MNEFLSGLLDLVSSVDPVLRTLLAGLGMMLETSVLVGLVIPGDTIVLVASTAVGGIVEYVALVLVVIAGALLGESIGFGLGHHFGPAIRASRLGQAVGERHWKVAENYTERRAGIAVFISRFLPVLHSLVPLTAGMSTMRYRTFIAWTTPACVLWATVYVGVGWLAAGSYRELSSQLHWAGFVFVAIIVAFLALVALTKRLLMRSQERHMGHPQNEDAPRDDS